MPLALEDVLVSFTERYRKRKLLVCCLAEFVGTFLLVTFGLGA
jgi:glycerol uptake facilitator-like aquaporin